MDFETNSDSTSNETALQISDESYRVVAAPTPAQRGWGAAFGVMLLAGIVVAVALVTFGVSALAGPRSTRGTIYIAPRYMTPTITTRDVLPAPASIDPKIVVNTGCINVTTKKAGSSMAVQTVQRCAGGAEYDLIPTLSGYIRAWGDHNETVAQRYTTGMSISDITGTFANRMDYGRVDRITLYGASVTVGISESGYTNQVASARGNVIFADGTSRAFYATLVKEYATTVWKIQQITLYR